MSSRIKMVGMGICGVKRPVSESKTTSNELPVYCKSSR